MTADALTYIVGGFAVLGIVGAIALVVKGIAKDGFSLTGGKPMFRAQTDDERRRDFKEELAIGTVCLVVLLVVTQCAA